MTLSENSEKIFKARYAFTEKEDWQGLSVRVGQGAASVEEGVNKWTDIFAEDIYNMLFLPGGRILRNIGRPRGTLFNCYVEPLEDSMEEIGEFQKNCGILWSEGGGVGCNASFLRPEGANIVQKGGTSSGPISFLKWANAGANCIMTGGSRRAAALAMMLVSHPDIINFINAKTVDGELNCFNISVGVTERFLEAVEDDGDWTLHWKMQPWKTVRAREIWDLIIDNMVLHAEPGLINWDKLRSNNSYYFDPILSTNPCGEVPLGAHGVCCLGSLVLPNFITGTKNTNWKLMKQTVKNAVRFLDNIIQVNRYVLDDIKRKAFEGRRIGLGVMGLAEYLFAKEVRYGSSESITHAEELMKKIRNFAYEASIELAQEKGVFPKFDAREYVKAHFVDDLPTKLKLDIKNHGIRNVTLMAVAPTGTISLLPEVSSSIEPLFSKAYIRRDEVGDRMYIHPIYEKMVRNKEEIPDWFVDSYDITPQDHLEIQAIIQKYTDGAVSKTINCPEDFQPEQVSQLLLEYIRFIKGATLYRNNSRMGQILNPATEEQVREYIERDNFITSEDVEIKDCATGACEI